MVVCVYLPTDSNQSRLDKKFKILLMHQSDRAAIYFESVKRPVHQQHSRHTYIHAHTHTQTHTVSEMASLEANDERL